MKPELVKAHKKYATEMAEKETFELLSYTEQLFGSKCRALYNKKSGGVQLRVINAQGQEISKTADITLEQWNDRPAPDARTTPQADWAFRLCGYNPRK